MAILEDLGVAVPWAVALGFASLALYVAKGIAAPFNVSILGVRPFQFVADAIEAGIVAPLNGIVNASESALTEALSALVDDTATLLGTFLVLGIGIKDALTYLWNTALGPFVHSITNTIARDASHALSDATALAKTVEANLTSAESYAAAQAANALADAKAWARTEIDAARSATEEYADDAVAKLRSAESAAIDNAVDIAHAAEVSAEAAASTALAQVKAIAVGAEGDLTDFEAYIKSLGLPATIAGVASLSTLLTLVLSETGLENSSCRGKVKQICGTSPAAWESLLAGIAAIGLSFNLQAVVDAAKSIEGGVVDVVKLAA